MLILGNGDFLMLEVLQGGISGFYILFRLLNL